MIVIGTTGTIVLVKKDSPNLVNDKSPDGTTNPVDDIGLRVSTSGVNRLALPAGWIDFHHPLSGTARPACLLELHLPQQM